MKISKLSKEFLNIVSEPDRKQKEDKERKRIEDMHCIDDGEEEYVWFVERGNWEDHEVIEVCSTKEKAEKIKKIYNESDEYDLASVRKVRLNRKL